MNCAFQERNGLLGFHAASRLYKASAEVKGIPSCHRAPWVSLIVTTVPSSLTSHDVARSGTITEASSSDRWNRLFRRLLVKVKLQPPRTLYVSQLGKGKNRA